MRRRLIIRPGDTLIEWREVDVRVRLDGLTATIIFPFRTDETDDEIAAQATQKAAQRPGVERVLATRIRNEQRVSRGRSPR